jgi:hypothetical protein
MDGVPHEAGVKVHEHRDEFGKRVREFFDQKGYVRVRVRRRGRKRSKVRSLRALSSDRGFADMICSFLRKGGIIPLVYPIGKSYCIDIEGKHKLEAFLKVVGLDEGKRAKLEEALKPLSLSGREQGL